MDGTKVTDTAAMTALTVQASRPYQVVNQDEHRMLKLRNTMRWAVGFTREPLVSCP
jgi:hypothetical protein